jgi:hypothetical protein
MNPPNPPSLAFAAASSYPDTDCIAAGTKGMFMDIRGASSSSYLTRGVLRETFPGLCPFFERPGSNMYSAKVVLRESVIVAITECLHYPFYALLYGRIYLMERSTRSPLRLAMSFPGILS